MASRKALSLQLVSQLLEFSKLKEQLAISNLLFTSHVCAMIQMVPANYSFLVNHTASMWVKKSRCSKTEIRNDPSLISYVICVETSYSRAAEQITWDFIHVRILIFGKPLKRFSRMKLQKRCVNSQKPHTADSSQMNQKGYWLFIKCCWVQSGIAIA